MYIPIKHFITCKLDVNDDINLISVAMSIFLYFCYKHACNAKYMFRNIFSYFLSQLYTYLFINQFSPNIVRVEYHRKHIHNKKNASMTAQRNIKFIYSHVHIFDIEGILTCFTVHSFPSRFTCKA